MTRTPRALLVAATLALIAAAPALAQDDGEELGWHDQAELTLVLTQGNAESTTLGFKNVLRHLWEDARFRFSAGGIRVETTTVDRTAVGEPGDFEIVEEKNEEVTAESYYLRSRYDRDISDALFWFAGGGWDRNTFAGIESRFTTAGGVGNVWWEGDASGFRTDYGVTFTTQDNVDGESDNFAGLQLGWTYWRQLTDNTRFDSELVVDENLDRTSDFRTDFLNSLAVSMSERLALKVSYQIFFDNEPSNEELALVAAGGEPTGLVILTPLDEVDSILSLAVVIGF